MSTQRDEISEARARKGHALYVEGDRRPFAVEAERAYQRIRKRRRGPHTAGPARRHAPMTTEPDTAMLKQPGDPPLTGMDGLPARDDAELEELMQAARGLSWPQVDALIRNMYRAALAHERTGDPTYLTTLAADALATMRLHSDPAYQQAVEYAPFGPSDPSDAMDVREFLARYGF